MQWKQTEWINHPLWLNKHTHSIQLWWKMAQYQVLWTSKWISWKVKNSPPKQWQHWSNCFAQASVQHNILERYFYEAYVPLNYAMILETLKQQNQTLLECQCKNYDANKSTAKRDNLKQIMINKQSNETNVTRHSYEWSLVRTSERVNKK